MKYSTSSVWIHIEGSSAVGLHPTDLVGVGQEVETSPKENWEHASDQGSYPNRRGNWGDGKHCALEPWLSQMWSPSSSPTCDSSHVQIHVRFKCDRDCAKCLLPEVRPPLAVKVKLTT